MVLHHLRQNHRVLKGAASALAKIGRHGMEPIPREGDRALPGLELPGGDPSVRDGGHHLIPLGLPGSHPGSRPPNPVSPGRGTPVRSSSPHHRTPRRPCTRCSPRSPSSAPPLLHHRSGWRPRHRPRNARPSTRRGWPRGPREPRFSSTHGTRAAWVRRTRPGTRT